MSYPTYTVEMNGNRKPVVWLHGEIKTPPFSREGRIEAGTLLRRVQEGESLSLPLSRPMPSVGPRCHELRVRDATKSWRIVYRVDTDAVVIVDVFPKKAARTPKQVIETSRRRLAVYDAAVMTARQNAKKKGK
jgi:phage-related protein